MAVQMISYDLSKPGDKYTELYEAIMQIGDWWHCLQSVWLVNTGMKNPDVAAHLRQFIDSNDKLVVLELDGNWASFGLDQDCIGWLQTHLGA